jgi:hypothetical protein
MADYNKIGITNSLVKNAFPFKIDIAKDGLREDGFPQFQLAVNYHSRLFKGLGKTDKYLQWIEVKDEENNSEEYTTTIKGLDEYQKVPETFPDKNFYCVLKVEVEDLNAKSAEIVWVESDKSVNELQPVTFESTDNLRQVEARLIIGILVSDNEAVAGTPGGNSAVKSSYILQFINTNLIMCNMVFDGIPVIYPVPFGGGRLNF